MKEWLGFDFSQGSTKRGILVFLSAVAAYFLVPVEHREQAVLAIIGGHGVLGTILRDSPKSKEE